MASMAKEEDVKGNIIKGVLVGAFVLIGLIFLFGSFYTITSGQEGVLLTFNKAEAASMGPGLHFKIPLVQRIVKFDMTTQKFGADASKNTLETAASSDLQIVKVQLAVNYHVIAGKTPEIFTKVGTGFEDKVIYPSVHEATKAATAKFNAADLINKREDVRTEIENLLKEKLIPYNIVVEQVSITNFDFSEQFNIAIENKVTAEQQALKAQRDLERIKIEAAQAIAAAEGQKQAAIASAQGESEKVRLVQEQLKQSPQYIEYIRVQRWDGHYPTYYMGGSGGNVIPFINIPSVSTPVDTNAGVVS